MLCEECHKNEATIHFTQMVNGQKTEKKICKECAAQKGFQVTMDTVENIVSKIASDLPETVADEGEVLVCKNCGTTFAQFQSSGRLGCGNCYYAFEDKLKDLLRKIHGSIKHVGKSPLRKCTESEPLEHRIRELRERLRETIQREQFEEAALLRDEIKRLEGACG